MVDESLRERERALENVFFAQESERLLQRMREADAARSRKAALAAGSGIADEAVLDQLAALGLGPQGVAALALAPVVLVAWADGTLDPKERDAIQQAAQKAGLAQNPEGAGPARRLALHPAAGRAGGGLAWLCAGRLGRHGARGARRPPARDAGAGAGRGARGGRVPRPRQPGLGPGGARARRSGAGSRRLIRLEHAAFTCVHAACSMLCVLSIFTRSDDFI